MCNTRRPPPYKYYTRDSLEPSFASARQLAGASVRKNLPAIQPSMVTITTAQHIHRVFSPQVRGDHANSSQKGDECCLFVELHCGMI